MDASVLRWTLAIIGVVLLIGIYLYGRRQNRMRQDAARDTLMQEEIDSISGIINTDIEEVNPADININPTAETDPVPPEFEVDRANPINHLLMHADRQPLTTDDIKAVLSQAGIIMNPAGLLEYHDADRHCFTIASLSEPGHFAEFEVSGFTTLGLNCFINPATDDKASENYETMLNKIDQLVELLDFKVYRSDQQLLTIDDIIEIRNRLAD